MPFWSRLAIADYRKRGYGLTEIARVFRCAPRTIWNITHKSLFLSLVLTMLVGTNRNKGQLVARGASQNIFEMLVLFVRDELAIKNIGKEEGPRYVPYLLTAFFFILFMNLLGLFPWMATATGNIAVTLGLALCTFVLTQVAGIRAAGFGGYLAHLTGGIVIFFLLGLIFMLGHPAVALVSVPFAMGIYLLELFVAFVQAYVFTMLSALFIGMGVAMGHHAHADEHHKEPGHSHDHGKAHMLGS